VLSPSDVALFEKTFGVAWEMVVKQQKILNAADTCHCLSVTDDALYELWKNAQVMVRIRKGLHIARLDSLPPGARQNNKLLKPPLYVINGFYGSMRDSYTQHDASVYYFALEWAAETMQWPDFLSNVIGDRSPHLSRRISLRGSIYVDWEQLGLAQRPCLRDNGVHGSLSAFEALAERHIWLKSHLLFTDLLGSKLLSQRVPSSVVKAWLKNPSLSPHPPPQSSSSSSKAAKKSSTGTRATHEIEVHPLSDYEHDLFVLLRGKGSEQCLKILLEEWRRDSKASEYF